MLRLPAENKIYALQTLAKSRPLLAREQLELEMLPKILAVKTKADALIQQLQKTPTDTQIRELLIKQLKAVAEFLEV
jgi:hypothetical protein